MKNLRLFIILFSLLFATYCYAQCGWVCTYPYPTTNDLYSIAYVNNNTAVAVGRLGTILLTSNGGVNWINKLPCSQDTLNQILFTDQYTGYAGGTEGSIPSKGIIYKTTDGGNYWNRIIAAEYFYIKCIYFQNSNSGFVGGKGNANLLRTTNGGINWTIIPNSMNIIIESIYFSNNSTGYIFGSFGDSAKIYKTTNSGSNWISLISMSYTQFYAMHFLNDTTGFVSGRTGYNTSILLKTTNSGANWIYIYNQNYMYSLFFTTFNTGYACGYHFVSKTTNGGNNWISINNPNINECINFNDINNGFTVGYDGSILKTTNEGQSWIQNSQISNPGYIHKIQFTKRDTGFALNENNILRTFDKGNSWQNIYQINYPPLRDLYAVNSDTVYVCGGVESDKILLKTTNRGINWIEMNININQSLVSISFLNSQTGFCSGNQLMLKTTNGGLNWSSQAVNFAAWGSGNIVIVDSNVVYVNSWSQTLKTTNGGVNWVNVSHPGFGIHNLYFFNVNTGFAVGYNYSVFKTTNGGSSWLLKSTSQGYYFNSIHFVSNNIGYVVGDQGRIMKTDNGGENWINITSPTDKTINSLYIADTNNINIGGGWFTAYIYKSTTGGYPIGVNILTVNLPSKVALSQNFPNPFNPQTKIKFAVPSNVKRETSNVKLIIYDLLGREVATLVNEELKPGSYEADWDGSNYSSGVYFYKIITNEFTETRKMVLMK